jgi:Leucine-rich repeat (LRR) protein
MSLDLSHNDITDLSAVLTQLQQLPTLRSLSLKGNPASLAAGYRQAVLQALPQLLYLDGQVSLRTSAL